MNNKTQFFILSILIFSMALTAMAYAMTLPSILSRKGAESQMGDYNDFTQVINAVKQSSQELQIGWGAAQSMKAGFSIKNLGAESPNMQAYFVKIQGASGADFRSFELRGSKKYSVANFGENDYLLFFHDDLKTMESKDYGLFYSNATDTIIPVREYEPISSYYETSSQIIYESITYSANISKITGIASIYLPQDSAPSITLQAGSENSYMSSCSPSYFISSSAYGSLTIYFQCDLGEGVSINQSYSLSPDFIAVSQEFTIASPASHDLLLMATTNLASQISNGKYAITYTGDKGALLIFNDSIPSISTTQINCSEKTLNYAVGQYSQGIIIMPYYGHYNYSINAAQNYLSNPQKYSIMLKDDFFSHFSSSIKKSSLSTLSAQSFSTQAILQKNSAAIYSLKPFSGLSQAKMNIENIGKELIGAEYGFLIAGNSSIPYSLCTNHVQGIESIEYEFAKIDNSTIIISLELDNEANLKIIAPDESIITDEDINQTNIVLSFEPKGKGIYKAIISNQSVCAKIGINAPLLSASSPIILDCESECNLFFSASQNFTLSKKNIEGIARLWLYDNYGLINSSLPDYSYTSGKDYYPKNDYYLKIEEGTVLLNNSLNYGIQSSYLPYEHLAKVIIIDDFKTANYYTFSQEEKNDYCEMDYSNGKLTANDYSLNLSSNELLINSANWLSGPLISINGEQAEFQGIAVDSCPLKSFNYSANDFQIILSAFNNSNLFMMEFSGANESFELSMNISILGNADNYYNLNSLISNYYASSASINYKELVYGYNFASKNDSENYFSIFFDYDCMDKSSQAITFANDYISLSINKFCKRIFFQFSNDSSKIMGLIDGFRNNLGQGNYAYNYTFSSTTLDSRGTLLG